LANFFEIKLKVMMDHHVGGGDTSNIWFSWVFAFFSSISIQDSQSLWYYFTTYAPYINLLILKHCGSYAL
jgi:hypothetical protein